MIDSLMLEKEYEGGFWGMREVVVGVDIAYGMGGILMEVEVGAWLFEEESYCWSWRMILF